MKARVWLLFAGVVVLLLTAGCASQPATAAEAVATARAFLTARAAKDVGALYGVLTPPVRDAVSLAEVAGFISRERFTFGSVGLPVERDEGWVQIPVFDVAVTTTDWETRWPEYRLTLRHDGRRWQVAWVDPLAHAALSAYQNSRYGDQLELARQIAQADPFHYRGPLERHYAYRGLKRLREAELALLRASELATPAQVAHVQETLARFRLDLNQPADAAALAREALRLAPAGLYSPAWRADTLVVLARALVATGDRPGAEAAIAEARALDPQNASLAILVRSLPGG